MTTGYTDITHLITRLQRCLLEALKMELNRVGILDLTPAQALLLSHIGNGPVTIRELIKRGCYQGANISYTIKKLTALGYLKQHRCPHDRRSVTLRLTALARTVTDHLQAFEAHIATTLYEGGQTPAQLQTTVETLRAIEHTWLHHQSAI